MAIYSAVGLRHPEKQARIGKAVAGFGWRQVKRLRRDAHNPGESCWLHDDDFCFAA